MISLISSFFPQQWCRLGWDNCHTLSVKMSCASIFWSQEGIAWQADASCDTLDSNHWRLTECCMNRTEETLGFNILQQTFSSRLNLAQGFLIHVHNSEHQLFLFRMISSISFEFVNWVIVCVFGYVTPPPQNADSPAVLHVGGFVHADGQFDLQGCVLAVLGDRHWVEFSLLWPVCGRTDDHLKDGRD